MGWGVSLSRKYGPGIIVVGLYLDPTIFSYLKIQWIPDQPPTQSPLQNGPGFSFQSTFIFIVTLSKLLNFLLSNFPKFKQNTLFVGQGRRFFTDVSEIENENDTILKIFTYFISTLFKIKYHQRCRFTSPTIIMLKTQIYITYYCKLY